MRARDLKTAGIPLVYLKRLTAAGDLVRRGRGLYQTPDRIGEDVAHDLAEAAHLVPNGVVSLISALRKHELTTQLPHAVWMTIPHKARTPNPAGLRLEVSARYRRSPDRWGQAYFDDQKGWRCQFLWRSHERWPTASNIAVTSVQGVAISST